MTLLYWYVLVGLPLIILGMGFGAVKLAAWDARRADDAEARKEPR